MNKRLKAIVYLGSDLIQNSQLYTGLGLLKHKGAINLLFKRARNGIKGKNAVECIVEDKKIAFEFHDRAAFIEKDSYQWCDFYFKRSVTEDVVKKNDKIMPWGLNFAVTSFYDFGFERTFYNFNPKSFLKNYFQSSTVLSRLFNIRNGAYTSNWKRIQQQPVKYNHPLIAFNARLWDPESLADDYKKADRYRINEERINFVNALKKNFPAYYKGGIEDSPYARKVCPDIILSPGSTNSIGYMKALRESAIGVATPGLLGSIGWKFSEYLLFSKAIVSNDIEKSVLIAPCDKEVNYIPYVSQDTMLAGVERLLRDGDFRYSMMVNNYNYAQNYMMPDKQLAIALNKAGFDIKV